MLGVFTLGNESKAREELKKQRDFYGKEKDKYLNLRSKEK